jgi:hypothetical protein
MSPQRLTKAGHQGSMPQIIDARGRRIKKPEGL